MQPEVSEACETARLGRTADDSRISCCSRHPKFAQQCVGKSAPAAGNFQPHTGTRHRHFVTGASRQSPFIKSTTSIQLEFLKHKLVAAHAAAASSEAGEGKTALAVEVKYLFGRCHFARIAAHPVHQVLPE